MLDGHAGLIPDWIEVLIVGSFFVTFVVGYLLTPCDRRGNV